MAEPKLRFKRDDGSSYPEWRMQSVGDLTVELSDYKPLNSGLPLLTSARTGLMFQDEYRSKSSTDNDETLFSVVPRGAVTYRHMSDDNVFHFNINDLVDAGLVSKEYPVFNTVNGNNVRLLVEYLNSSKDFLEFCKAQKKGGTRTRLYFKVLKDYELMFPCLEEQQKIADFLSSVDEVISSSEQEVANLETQKKAVMKKIFSQEVRFKRDDETEFPEWKETTFGEIGAPYKNSIVDGPFGSNLKTQDYTESGVLVFQSNYITSGSFSIDKPFYVSKKKAEDLKRCSAKSGDILIAKIGARFGMCDIIPPNIEGILSSNSMKIDLDSRVALNAFYKFYLRYLYDTKYHYREIGITAQPALSLSYIRELVVPLPSLEEQRLIADFLSSFDETIAAGKRELELWKELKKALLQQMFV